MKNRFLSNVLPHVIAIAVFLIVAIVYCKPVLEHQVLQQSDVIHWKGMAQGSFEYKEKYGHFPLWTNNLFSGMPAYQIALDSDVIITPSWFYNLFTLFLPKPISFFFLASICFYFLTQVFRVNSYLGIIGGLAYAYATYNPIIISVGHDTKMQSIALMPAFLASLVLIYNKKYLWGAAFTVVITAILVGINHVQIIYYLLLIAAIMTIVYAVSWIRQRDFRHLFIATSIAILCGVLGTLSNAISLFTSFEASKTSIRGGSELVNKNTTQEGLSKDYAFDYSMYRSEPFVMLVPKMYGGSTGLEVDEEQSKAIAELRQMPQGLGQQLQGYLQFYWGGIGGTSGPPYVGAIICFLALLGFVLLNNRDKVWILIASALAIVMSWGGYFAAFNGFLLNHLPFYNKFRAPSMIIVIPTLLFCLMAVLALQRIVEVKNKQELWEKYKTSLVITGSLFIALLVFYFNADYTLPQDKQLVSQVTGPGSGFITSFVNALKEDRKGLFGESLLRSFLFITGAALLIFLYIKEKIKAPVAFACIGIAAFIDVMAINVKYLNAGNYQDEAEYQQSYFTPSPADQQVLQDKGYYRIFDNRDGVGSAYNASALSAYFHRSIGGYHPAKLSIYQDLIARQLYNYPNCTAAINMLNTKYIIERDSTGKDVVRMNANALGPVWFVDSLRFESTPEAVMNGLSTLDPKGTAIVFTKDKELLSYTSSKNSSDVIKLIENKNDDITYESNAATPRFAVFSEVFYDRGWKAYIDNKEAPIIRSNYVLRGLLVPAGQHQIKFEFRPAAYYNGRNIAKVAGIIAMLLVVATIGLSVRNYLKKPNLDQ
ncbi:MULTISPECIES: YfhO family protein [Niastella]|uniref:YfhO family protein n=1 Tax=Niastella soli TaxID=2821487 RepID=A0ABS3YYE7_9BACT|nr:YfhO family protein [Niastella soli]MBO9202854.1 YfhO family protein [Niastella soli]